jgi:hypothetical protein
MPLMSEPTKGYTRLEKTKDKLPSRTTWEVKHAVEVLAGKLAGPAAGIRFQDRALTVEALVSAVMIDFLSRPWEEQAAIARECVPRLERNLEGGPLETDPAPPAGYDPVALKDLSESERRREQQRRAPDGGRSKKAKR